MGTQYSRLLVHGSLVTLETLLIVGSGIVGRLAELRSKARMPACENDFIREDAGGHDHVESAIMFRQQGSSPLKPFAWMLIWIA